MLLLPLALPDLVLDPFKLNGKGRAIETIANLRDLALHHASFLVSYNKYTFLFVKIISNYLVSSVRVEVVRAHEDLAFGHSDDESFELRQIACSNDSANVLDGYVLCIL